MTSAGKITRALCLVLTSLATSAFAAPAGDFSGTYGPGAPAAGEDVQITVSLSVANHPSFSIHNAAKEVLRP